MKARYFLTTCAVAMAMAASAGEYSASIAAIPHPVDSDLASVVLSMANSDAVNGFQCDILLPQGITPLVDLIVPTERSCRHSLKASRLDDGRVIVTCVSLGGETLGGNEGSLFTLPVKIDTPSAAECDIMASYIVLSTVADGRVVADDTSCQLTPSGLEPAMGQKVSILTENLAIRIAGAREASLKTLVDTAGRTIYHGTADKIAVGAHGVYILSVDGNEFKISL